MLAAVIGDIQVIGLGGELTGECVDLFDPRTDAVFVAQCPYFFLRRILYDCDLRIREAVALGFEQP